MEATRRNFLKMAALGAAGMAGGGMIACSSPKTKESQTETASTGADADGVYLGTAEGAKGEVGALVVIEGGAIKSVIAAPSMESPGLGETALEMLSKRAVEQQSVALDAISGATLTSMGYLSAMAQAVESAGLSDSLAQPVEPPASENSDSDVDVVIVGSGAAGLFAALTLKDPTYTANYTDTNVLVLEKLDIAGGSTNLCFGGLAAGDTLQANTVREHTSTPEQMVEMLKCRNDFGVNEPLAFKIFDRSPDILHTICDYGGPFAPNYAATLRDYNGYKYLQMDAHSDFILDEQPDDFGCFSNQGGNALSSFLQHKVKQSGVEIRTGAEVTELLMDGNAVAGVRVSERGNEYEVRAKKVILACGGFGASSEYMESINGDVLPNYFTFCCAGSTGTAFDLTANLGTTKVGEGALAYFALNTVRYGMYADVNNAMRRRQAVIVNEEGKRFHDESDDEYAIAYDISQSTGGHVFVVVDADNPDAAIFDRWADSPYVSKADSLEDLASQCGIDATTFVQTIETYNADAAAGSDSQLGTPADKMHPVKNGPFYAGELAICIIGTLVGLKANENAQILGTGDEPIENLYGTGEVVLGGNILSKLYAGGVSIATALGTGQIAAQHIMESL